jgi:hypothetical protein
MIRWRAPERIRRHVVLAVAASNGVFRTLMRSGGVLVIAVLAIAMVPHAGMAATALVDEPVLDPASGSYFVVKEMPGRGGPWDAADRFARSQHFKGRSGRLAIIRSKPTQDFLRANVKLVNPTWFGLRYDCATRTSIWVDGHVVSGKDFTYWHPQWVRDPTITCFNQNFYEGMNYMPVYLMSSQDVTPFFWQATGPAKIFEGVLIEFPQPQPAK